MNAVILEMQGKLRLKDELLNQLRAVVMDSETDAEHEPHPKPEAEAEETLPAQKWGSSTPRPVCFVDDALHLSLTSIYSIFTRISCISKCLRVVYKSDQVTES